MEKIWTNQATNGSATKVAKEMVGMDKPRKLCKISYLK